MPVQKKAFSFIATIDNVPETEKMAEIMKNMEDNIDNMSYSLKARYKQILISQMSLLKSTNSQDPNFTMKQSIKYVEFNGNKKPATQETVTFNNEKVRLKIEKTVAKRNTIPHENLSGNTRANFNNKIERNRDESFVSCKKENSNRYVSPRSHRAKSKSPVTERQEKLVSDGRKYIKSTSPESRTQSPKRVTFDVTYEAKGLSSDAIRKSEVDQTKPLKPIAFAPVTFRKNDTTDELVRTIRNKTQNISENKIFEPIPGNTNILLKKGIINEPLLPHENALFSLTEDRQRATRTEMRTRSRRHVYDPQPSGVIQKLDDNSLKDTANNKIHVESPKLMRNTTIIGKEGYNRDLSHIHNREMTRIGVSNGAAHQIPDHHSSMQGSVLHDNTASIQTVKYQTVVESDELKSSANASVAPKEVPVRSARYAAGGQEQGQVPTSQVSIRCKTNEYRPANGVNSRSLRPPSSFKPSYVVTPAVHEEGEKNSETHREDTTEHIPLCFTTYTKVRCPYIERIDKCTVQTTMFFNKDGNEPYEASEEETFRKACYVPKGNSRQDMPNRQRNVQTLDQILPSSVERSRFSCPPSGTGAGSPRFTSTSAGYGIPHRRAEGPVGSQQVPLGESSLPNFEMSSTLPPTVTRRMLDFSNDSGPSALDIDQSILTNDYAANYHTDQTRLFRDVLASSHGYTSAETAERNMCGNGRFGFDVTESQTLVLRRSERLTDAVAALMDRFNEVLVLEYVDSQQRLRLLEDLTRTTARLEMDIVSLSETNRRLAISCAQEVRVAEEQIIASVQHGLESSTEIVRRVALLIQRAFMHGAVHQNGVHLTSLRDVLSQLKELTVNVSQRFESPLAQDNASLPSSSRHTALCYQVLDGAANLERLPVPSLEPSADNLTTSLVSRTKRAFLNRECNIRATKDITNDRNKYSKTTDKNRRKSRFLIILGVCTGSLLTALGPPVALYVKELLLWIIVYIWCSVRLVHLSPPLI